MKLYTMMEVFNALLVKSYAQSPKVKIEFIMSEYSMEITIIILNTYVYTLNIKEVEEDIGIAYLFRDVMAILIDNYALNQIYTWIEKRKEFNKVEKLKLFLKAIKILDYPYFYEKLKKDKDVFEINKLFCKELEKMDLYEFLYGKDVE